MGDWKNTPKAPIASLYQEPGEVRSSWAPGSIRVTEKSQTSVKVRKKKKSRVRKLCGIRRHLFTRKWGVWSYAEASKKEGFPQGRNSWMTGVTGRDAGGGTRWLEECKEHRGGGLALRMGVLLLPGGPTSFSTVTHASSVEPSGPLSFPSRAAIERHFA